MRTAALAIGTGLMALAVACGGGGDSSMSAAPQPSGLPQIAITSGSLQPDGALPVTNSCDGEGRSPAISWHDVPADAASLVVLAEDPDANSFVHWAVYGIPGDEAGLEGGISDAATLNDGSLQGKNSFGKIGYGAPCPPKGSTHHYQFFVYALDARLGLPSGASEDQVTAAMSGHVTAWGMITVTFGH